MQFKNLLVSVLAIGLVLVGVSFFGQLNFADNADLLSRGKRVEILSGESIQQKFIAKHNKLNNLKILFGNKKLQEGRILQFTLADKTCQKKIAEKELKGEYNFDSKYLYNFDFPTIDNSKGKEYCLKIKLKTENEWTLWRKIKNKIKPEKKQREQKIRLFEQMNGLGSDEIKNKKSAIKDVKDIKGIKKENNRKTEKRGDNKNVAKNTVQNKGYIIKDKNGQTKYNGKNEIFFRQKYKNKTVWRDFQQLNQRISQYKPWFLKGGYLTTIFWLAVILSASGVYLLVIKKEKG